MLTKVLSICPSSDTTLAMRKRLGACVQSHDRECVTALMRHVVVMGASGPPWPPLNDPPRAMTLVVDEVPLEAS